MARYREYCSEQAIMVPVTLSDQLRPGTFEYAIHELVDHHIDLSPFDDRYCNDETGAPAIDPAILLKLVLFAYSRGIISSRRIARECEQNIVFMALAADTRPHFTTIADFITTMEREIVGVFRDVLTVCYSEGLIGRRMFAIDGCKISANCAKEWSGTRAELMKKAGRIESAVGALIARHRGEDESGIVSPRRKTEHRTIATLTRKAEKITQWLADNDERIGRQGKPVKSNITDNHSAKLVSAHGVLQGYTGIAAVDDAHQVIVDAQAFGDGHEAVHVPHIIESIDAPFAAIDPERKIFESVVVTADSGFNSEAATRAVLEAGIDASIANPKFRKRDPRFASQQEYKARTTDRKQTSRARRSFGADAFEFDETGVLICPAGKPMKSRCPNGRSEDGFRGRSFKGHAEYCSVCELRSRCMRKPTTPARQVTKIEGGIRDNAKRGVQRMIERFDTERGRSYYRRRMGTVEPVFDNTRATVVLDRFTLRGRPKVDTQWKLFCIVHTIGKLARYGPWAAAPSG